MLLAAVHTGTQCILGLIKCVCPSIVDKISVTLHLSAMAIITQIWSRAKRIHKQHMEPDYWTKYELKNIL